jgi:hypothetical protein
MKMPVPIFIGYFPKTTMGRNDWFGNAPVQEVCSVSDCMSGAPTGWIDEWKHNAWFVYDTEEMAWRVVHDDPAAYDMYAYKLFPFVFDGGAGSAVDVVSTATANLSDFDFVGYDPVSRELDVIGFGCSPLSCNKGFERYPVNRFCLLDDLEGAWRITDEIAKAAKETGSWEPGPYCLCEVYRKRRRRTTA